MSSRTSSFLPEADVGSSPAQVSYQQLVDLFFSRHDATTMNRQKNDVGTQYRSAIFTHGDEQLQVLSGRKSSCSRKNIVLSVLCKTRILRTLRACQYRQVPCKR